MPILLNSPLIKRDSMRAVVVKHTGSHYLLSDIPRWDPFLAVVKGKLRLDHTDNTNPIAVGDIVEYEKDVNTSGGALCTIKEVLPRKNCIVRRSANLSRQNHVIAANIDKVFLVVTMVYPQIKTQFIDRFLVTCQAYDAPVSILLNKSDFYLDKKGHYIEEDVREEVEHFKSIYEGAGYEVIDVSAKNLYNIPLIREMCKDKIVLFSGQSGVGKSSIINAIDSTLNLKTDKISSAHLQGKHTTTFYQMHKIGSGGFVIDTPGIRGFGLVNFEKEELSNFFPEMLRVESNCKYVPCTHTHEPNCAVKKGVEEGIISPERYASYIAMLEEDSKYRSGDE